MPRPSSSNVTQAMFAQAIEQAAAKQRGGWLDEVEKIYTELLKVAPGEAEALLLLGALYRQYGRSEDALRLIEKALAVVPGDFALQRARAEILDELTSTQRHFTKPSWRGDGNLGGKTILLHAGQDFGDTLQFLRYAGVIAHQGARVVLEVQAPLKRLAISSFPDMKVLACGETLPPSICMRR